MEHMQFGRMDTEDDLVNLKTESNNDEASQGNSFMNTSGEPKNAMLDSDAVFKYAMGSMAASSQASNTHQWRGNNTETPDW